MNKKCYFCKKEKKLIKAHIVPECFLKGDSKSVKEKNFIEASIRKSFTKKRIKDPYDDKRLIVTKKSPKGSYDDKILCGECDNIIGKYDGYAKRILVDDLHKYKGKNNSCYFIPSKELNYIKLKKFFISLIWRASISDRDMYSRVRLGPYNDRAVALLKDEEKLSDDIFAVLIFKDSKTLKYQDVVSFASMRLAIKKAYKIHFSGYQISIIPNAKDMTWNIKNNTMSPAELFLQENKELFIPTLDVDISGKDELISYFHHKIKAHSLIENLETKS